MTSAVIGISPAAVRTSSEVADFRLGTRAGYDDPDDGYQEFLYVEAGEAITAAGYLCVVDSAFVAEMVDTTSTAPGAGMSQICGAAMAAIESGGFGWLQIYGKGSVRTLALAAKQVKEEFQMRAMAEELRSAQEAEAGNEAKTIDT